MASVGYCDCGRRPGECVRGDADHCPGLDEEDEQGDDEEFWLEQMCGLMADGQCAMAGTEHCDFSCFHRDSEDFAGSAAWNKKHARS
jgi:hypothetical protein